VQHDRVPAAGIDQLVHGCCLLGCLRSCCGRRPAQGGAPLLMLGTTA
jgi:hypothetical protein